MIWGGMVAVLTIHADRNRILEGERIRAGNGNITSEETLAMIRVMPSEALSGEDDDAANDDAESPEEEALASTTQEQGLDVHTQNDTLEVNAPGSSLSTAEVFNRMQASKSSIGKFSMILCVNQIRWRLTSIQA